MKRITIADVAAQAGVSKSTVSHALSGKRPISEDTRQRIFQVIDQLGYQPHPVAQRLAGQPSRTIGFVFPLYAPQISGLETKFIVGAANVINNADYAFLLLTHPQQSSNHLQSFVQGSLADGFILMQVLLEDPRVELLRQSGLPFVLVGRCADNTGLAYVDLDIDLAISECVNHLVGLGHRSIAYLHQDAPNFGFASRAQQAFKRVCQLHNLAWFMQPCQLSSAGGEAATHALLNRHPHTTAVIVWNDLAAWGVAQAAQNRGLSIPTDLSLITFDYSTIIHVAPFKPTAVDIEPEKITNLAATMLLKYLAGQSPAQAQVLVKPRLIIGESTAPPASIN